jgi:cellulose biosynthesis protein BcsQ
MRALLVTNHKGGIGKTFVAVHLAQWLAAQDKRVLVVDCDGQYDAFMFLARKKPQTDGEFWPTQEQALQAAAGGMPPVSVIANRECKALRVLGFDEGIYDYVVLDADARLADAAKNILQNQIRLVLAPVNFQTLSIYNLDDLFLTVGKLYGIERPFDDKDAGDLSASAGDLDAKLVKLRRVARSVARHVFVVPLGADDTVLTEKLKKCRVKSKVYIAKNMPSLPEATNESLARGVPVWEHQELSQEERTGVKDCFKSLADRVQAFFDNEEAQHGSHP